jgi:hypothetical protein
VNNKKLYRTALIAAVLSTLGWVAYILGSSGMPDLAAANDSSHYIAMIREARPAMLLFGWDGVTGTLFVIPYLVAFHEANEEAGTIRSVPVLIAVIGVVFTAVGFMSNSPSPVYFMLPGTLEAGAESLPQMLIAMEFAADASEAGWWVGSFMVYGVGCSGFQLKPGRQTPRPNGSVLSGSPEALPGSYGSDIFSRP